MEYESAMDVGIFISKVMTYQHQYVESLHRWCVRTVYMRDSTFPLVFQQPRETILRTPDHKRPHP
jgi:hypothetical protein